jgi:hypothetical protein
MAAAAGEPQDESRDRDGGARPARRRRSPVRARPGPTRRGGNSKPRLSHSNFNCGLLEPSVRNLKLHVSTALAAARPGGRAGPVPRGGPHWHRVGPQFRACTFRAAAAAGRRQS